MKNTKKRRLCSVHGLLFYLHHRKTVCDSLHWKERQQWGEYCCPRGIWDFIPLLFSAHGVLYTVFAICKRYN